MTLSATKTDEPRIAAPPAVLVEHLSKTYGIIKKVNVLDDVSLRIEKGEIFALIGPNGAGKTTLMGCLLALLRPQKGKISIFGYPPDHIEARRRTGFLPERPAFETYMHAREFLHYHYLLTRQPPDKERESIQAALELVELESVGTRRIAKFSRGMLQRLGLAQMLIGNPEICFLDEPTSGMDPLGMELVRRVLVKLQSEGCTVVVNSHHLDEVERVCTNFGFIRKGKVEKQATVSSVNQRVMVVRCVRGTSERYVQATASLFGASVLGQKDHEIRVELSKREDASAFIKALVENGVLIEECYFDKNALVDLFRGGQVSDV